ncbi:hypothetical protein [Nocardia amamiensis]|uniref:hypothetical protein n=1 Tax=Nocardia amamiensis TaxID=404578 RepID=UPI0012F4FB59|nr:hypothetical protein [Nocardia amamiensis]
MPATPDAGELADVGGEVFDALSEAAPGDLAGAPPAGLFAVAPLAGLEAGVDGPLVAGRDAGVPGAPGSPDAAAGRAAEFVPLVAASAVPGVPLDVPVAGFALGCCAEPVLPAGPDAGEFLGAEPGVEFAAEGPVGRDAELLAAPGLAGAVLASADFGAAELAFFWASALPPGVCPWSPPDDAPDAGPPLCPEADPFPSAVDSPAPRGDAGAVHAAQVPARRGG